MISITTILRTLISYILILTIMVFTAVPAAIILLLPERWRYNSRLYYWLVYQFCNLSLKATFLPITFEGRENIPAHKPLIFAANHSSAMDALLMNVVVKDHPHVWLAWVNLTRLFFVGFIIKRMAVLIDMSTPQKGAYSLRQAVARIKNNNHHVIIFPEGGRYIDGKVHDFFSGFVILAKQTGRAVVPVLITNAAKVFPPGAFWIHYYPVRVIIGKPFECGQTESDQEFKQRVHQWFVKQLEK